jgi:hypothetical protein
MDPDSDPDPAISVIDFKGEAQKHVDPLDPDLDSDPDPEHW